MQLFARNRGFCFLIVTGFALLVALSGCAPRRPIRSGQSAISGTVFELTPESDPLHLRFHVSQWPEGLILLRVDDLLGREHSSGDFYYDEGSAWNEVGARYKWRLDTSDGKTATFRINDKNYDLSEGTLFVIKAKSDKVEVHQLCSDLSALPFDSAAIGHFLKNNAEVRKIFGASDIEKQK